jgi:thiamine pyrophosphate-dependent acetolactate synthase large subunit-like protein
MAPLEPLTLPTGGPAWSGTCAQDPAAFMRDFVKWDDQPASLQHFAESAVRAYKIMMTPPQEPVLISCDIELQEEQMHGEHRPERDLRRFRRDRKSVVRASRRDRQAPF